MLQAQKPKGDRILAPEGTHHAVVINLIQIGTVHGEYQGTPNDLPKIRLTFELCDELHEFNGEEKPLVISQEYTLSMGEKANLRKIVEGILGVALHDDEAYSYDAEDLVGKNCLITIKHKESKAGNKYVVISTTAPLMKGMKVRKPFNQTHILTYDHWDPEFYDTLPGFIKDAMVETPEYRKKFNVEPVDGYPAPKPDAIPF